MSILRHNDIMIEEESLQEIYSIFGYPRVNLEDIKLFGAEDIRRFAIAPSLRTYYKYFPKEEIQTIRVSSQQVQGVVDFPETALGVSDVKFVNSQDTELYHSGGTNGGAFFTHRSIGRGGAGRYGSRYGYGRQAIQSTVEMSLDVQSNIYKSFYWNPDFTERTFTYRVTNSGYIEITWALWDFNFDKVRLEQYDNLIKLCQAEILLYWARILEKVTPDLPVEFDSDSLRDEGEEFKKDVLEKWQGHTKAVMMRGAV